MKTSHKDLQVWKNSIEMVVEIYSLTRTFPAHEQYGLCSQLRRAAVSVPANIAEGKYRLSQKEFIRFLNIALGSIGEIETLLEIVFRLDYCSKEQCKKIEQLVLVVGKMLYGLRSALKG